MHSDYDIIKEQIMSLKVYVEKNSEKWQLCHIDSIADNFLFLDKL